MNCIEEEYQGNGLAWACVFGLSFLMIGVCVISAFVWYMVHYG
jgi:hypothetical protein